MAAAEPSSGPARPALAVGSRVLVGGRHKATVRYLGPLQGQAGQWAGLEWDDASRGKHDGTHAGVRYFAVADPSSAPGSFVRLEKLLEAADPGCGVLEAAQQRYAELRGGGVSGGGAAAQGAPGSGGGGKDVQESEDGLAAVSLPTASGRREVAVAVLGGDVAAAHRAARFAHAALVDARVSHVGPAGALSAALPAVSELDLSGNLVPGLWEFVPALCAALPTLRVLDLSGNALDAAPPRVLPPPAPLGGLSVLVLNHCRLGWRQAVAAGAALPALRELRLVGNAIAGLDPGIDSGTASGGSGGHAAPPAAGGTSEEVVAAGPTAAARLAAAFPHLRLLDLDSNRLGSWQAGPALLRTLPSLRALLLSGNALASLAYPPGGFTALSSLLLGDNRLSGWADVDALACFPALVDARLSGNPLPAPSASAARYEVIARVGSLVQLNGSAVGRSERRDAELSYLRQVTDDLARAGGEAERQRLLAAHPRFAELSAHFGPLAPAGGAQAAGPGRALAGSMVQATLVCGGKEVSRRLPASMTVAQLKLLAQRLFGVHAQRQAVVLLPPPAGEPAGSASAAGASAGAEDITSCGERPLSFFSIVDGSRIEVSKAGTSATQHAGHAGQTHLQARWDAHEQALQALRAEEGRLLSGGAAGGGRRGV